MFPPSSRFLALFLAVLAVTLAAPGAVVAQGPGDDQYTDPFGELPEEEPAGDAAPPPEEPAEPPPSGGDDSAAVAPQPAEVAPEAVPSDTVTETAGTGELARTGLPAAFLAVLGLGMLCSGALLRVGLLSRGRRPAPSPFGAGSAVHQAPRLPGSAVRRR